MCHLIFVVVFFLGGENGNGEFMCDLFMSCTINNFMMIFKWTNYSSVF